MVSRFTPFIAVLLALLLLTRLAVSVSPVITALWGHTDDTELVTEDLPESQKKGGAKLLEGNVGESFFDHTPNVVYRPIDLAGLAHHAVDAAAELPAVCLDVQTPPPDILV